jgi:uncharacterized RDD family membrane protein YckC
MPDDSRDVAGPWPRLFAASIDAGLFLLIVSAALTWTYGWSYWKDPFGAQTALGAIAIAVFAPMAACVGFWTLQQGTPGKMALSLAVVDAHTGESVSVTQGALRSMGYLLSALPLGLGLLWIAIDPRRQGWHDKIAGTVVLSGMEMAVRGRRMVPHRRGGHGRERDQDGDWVDRLPLPDTLDPARLGVKVLREPGGAVLLAVLLLAAGGICALIFARPLSVAGPWAETIGALVLLGHALGLLLGRRVSWLFATALFAVLALCGAGMAVWLFMQLPRASGWDGLALLAYATIYAIPIGLAACALAVAIWHARTRFEWADTGRPWSWDAAGVVLSFAVFGWVGLDLAQPRQHCDRGAAQACQQLRSSSRPATPSPAAASLRSPSPPGPSTAPPSPSAGRAASASGIVLMAPRSAPAADGARSQPAVAAHTTPRKPRDLQAIRRRVAAVMPTACPPLELWHEGGRYVVEGLTREVPCVSEALRALDSAGAQPLLLEVAADAQRGFRYSLSISAAFAEAG